MLSLKRFLPAFLVFVAFTSFLLFPDYLRAELEKVKDEIWRDCQKASQELASTKESDKENLINFLTGIVELELSHDQQQAVPLNPASITGSDGVLSDVSLAQSLDPQRFVRAKRCAAEMLLNLAPVSYSALPALVANNSDIRLSQEIRSLYARAAFGIAQQVSQRGVAESDLSLALQELFKTFTESNSALAEEVLNIFPDQFVKMLLHYLEQKNCQAECDKESRLVAYLGKVEQISADSKQLIFATLPRIQPVLRKEVVKAIRFNRTLLEASLAYFLANIAAAEASEKELFFENLNAIFDYELRSASFAINPKDRLKLVSELALANQQQRDVIEKGLTILAPFSEDLPSAVTSLADSQDSDLRIRAARLLFRVKVPGSDTKRALNKLLHDPDTKVRLVALEASLGRQEAASVLKNAMAIHKKIRKSFDAKEIDSKECAESYLFLLRVVSQVSIPTLPEIWFEIAIETIRVAIGAQVSSSELKPALLVLRSDTQKMLKQLRLFARSDYSDKKLTAIQILRNSTVPDASIYETLLSLVSDSDPEVAKNAELALLSLKSNLQELFSAKRHLAPSPRLDELQLEAGLKPEIKFETAAALATSPCSEISDFVPTCLSREKIGEFCNLIISQIPRCSEGRFLETLPAPLLHKAVSLQSAIREVFERSILDPATDVNLKLKFAILLVRARVASEVVIGKFCESAQFADRKELEEVVLAAQGIPTTREKCLIELKRQFEDSKLASAQRAQILSQIVLLDPQAINLSVMLDEAFEKNDIGFLKVVSNGQLLNELLPILGEVLRDSDRGEQERLLALEILENLGEKAASQQPLVIPLLESQSNEVRYRAARVVIASNVDLQQSLRALRSILNSQKIRDLLSDTELVPLSRISEILAENGQQLSALERRNLLRLTRAIQGDERLVPESLGDLAEATTTPLN